MNTKRDPTRYRKALASKVSAYVTAKDAARALACAHPEVDERAARRHFQSLWFHGVPVREVLRLMDGPASELPERVRTA